jgi:hypothetical protein
MERKRCPRADLQSAPGRLRASFTPALRPVREVLPGLGQMKAGNPRQPDELACGFGKPVLLSGSHVSPRPRKHGLELSQLAFGLVARTAVERRKASGPRWGRVRTRWCGPPFAPFGALPPSFGRQKEMAPCAFGASFRTAWTKARMQVHRENGIACAYFHLSPQRGFRCLTLLIGRRRARMQIASRDERRRSLTHGEPF